MSADIFTHHPDVRRWLHSSVDVSEVRQVLTDAGTFRFAPLDSGLFAAADLDEETGQVTGYGRAWTRDNVHVAHAMGCVGRAPLAVGVGRALLTFYTRYQHRFQAVIDDPTVAESAMLRPHIRFDGVSLEELDQKWTHAQNDALGYFGWLVARLAIDGQLTVSVSEGETLALLGRYFEAVQYWQDADSGHWEERAMVHASSIGPVVAGLEAMALGLRKGSLPAESFARHGMDADRLEAGADRGRTALDEILPHEAKVPFQHTRKADAALLFLVYPLELYPLESDMGRRIVQDVVSDLEGPLGIRRYLKDSYWAPDFDVHISKVEERTQAEGVRHLDVRDELYQPGGEAQWCLFDATLASAYARAYGRTQDPNFAHARDRHLFRALGQLTGPDAAAGPWKMPEAYYKKGDRWIANPHTPLLWSAANLEVALYEVEASRS